MYFAFQFPYVLYTSIFILQGAVILISLLFSSHEFDSFFSFIPISLMLSRSPISKLFHISTHITCVLICYLFYEFFKNVASKTHSKIDTTIRYIIFLNSFGTIAGLIGFSSLSEFDLINYQTVMEFLFFFSAQVNFILCDYLLKRIGYTINLPIIFYNAFSSFFIVSFHITRILSTVLSVEEIISISSFFEFVSYFLIFFKFPIFGWELSKTNLFNKTKRNID